MSDRNIDVGELTTNWTMAQPVVAAFIKSAEPNMQQAADILQEVALAIVRNYPQFDKNRSFMAWAIGIAKNQILMFHRQQSGDRRIITQATLDRAADIYQEKSDDLIEMKLALHHCIDRLQPRWKKILRLRYSLGLEVKSIAKQMSISLNTTFVTLHRIRLALRKCIEQRLNEEI